MTLTVCSLTVCWHSVWWKKIWADSLCHVVCFHPGWPVFEKCWNTVLCVWSHAHNTFSSLVWHFFDVKTKSRRTVILNFTLTKSKTKSKRTAQSLWALLSLQLEGQSEQTSSILNNTLTSVTINILTVVVVAISLSNSSLELKNAAWTSSIHNVVKPKSNSASATALPERLYDQWWILIKSSHNCRVTTHFQCHHLIRYFTTLFVKVLTGLSNEKAHSSLYTFSPPSGAFICGKRFLSSSMASMPILLWDLLPLSGSNFWPIENFGSKSAAVYVLCCDWLQRELWNNKIVMCARWVRLRDSSQRKRLFHLNSITKNT